MKGYIAVISPAGAITTSECKATPSHITLRELVNGYLEVVPRFDTYHPDFDEKVVRCVAFCNEEGKFDGSIPNVLAQMLWEIALNGLVITDFLFGNVVIVYGDDEFMKGL